MFRRKRPLEQIVEAKVKSFVEQNNIKTEEVEHILEKLSHHKPTSDLKFSYDKEFGMAEIILDDIVQMPLWVGFEDSYV